MLNNQCIESPASIVYQRPQGQVISLSLKALLTDMLILLKLGAEFTGNWMNVP
jgi:hypothetical protein